jgi:uncharacterized protein (DUF983 family)
MPIDVRTLEEMRRRVQGVPDGARCRKCGYDITGLKPNQRCPECGGALRFEDRLFSAAPEYVTKLYIGAILVEVSLVLIVVMFIGNFIGGMLQAPALVMVINLLAIPGPILALVGWWMLSTRDPGLGERDEGQRSRVAIRALLAIRALGTLVSISLLFTYTPLGVEETVSLLLNGVTFAGFVVSMLYVRVLAARIPDNDIIDRAGTVLRLGVFGAVGLGVLIAIALSAMASGSQMVLGIAGCGMMVFIIGFLVWGVLYILLIDALRASLGKLRDTM